MLRNKRGHNNEDVCALHLESSPYLLQLEKSPHSNEDPAQKKNNT